MWKKILGYDVFVEDGKIIRAMKNNGTLSADIPPCGYAKIEI